MKNPFLNFIEKNTTPIQRHIFNMLQDSKEKMIYPIFRPAGKNAELIHYAVLDPKVMIAVATKEELGRILDLAPSLKGRVILKNDNEKGN